MEQREENQAHSREHRRSLIGFLAVEPTSDQIGLIGAMLVLDDKGYPLEFRCTTPVRPTTIQKALLGSRLEYFVGVELCGKRLLPEVQRKPALIVTSSLDLLALSEGEIPIVVVLRAGEVIETESLAKDVARERLESASGRFQPVILMTRQDQQEEAKDIKDILNAIFRDFDLLEPFERIRIALAALAENDSKYR